MTEEDLQERIKRRAYQLWEQDGRPEGRASEYWARAEAEVADRAAGASPGTPGAGAQVCPDCGGSGRRGRGRCRSCGGTGRVPDNPQP